MISNKNIRAWFPTLIYENTLTDFEIHNAHLESKAQAIRQSLPAINAGWNCDTYNTLCHHDLLHDTDPIIQELIRVCKEHVIDFAAEYGITKPVGELHCIDAWFNIAKHGDYQEYHLHPRSDFSLVYYVKTKPKCGNIVFQNTSSIVDMYPLITEESTHASFKTCFYTPANSVLLIFRSNLSHMVEKNLSNEDRMSIAMNFRFKED